MARQRRPERKPHPTVTSPNASAAVSYRATKDVRTALGREGSGGQAFVRSQSVADTRSQLGNEGMRKAALAAGYKGRDGKGPSDRTLRRWAQNNSIPDARVAESMRRRAEVKQMGGVKAVARRTGRSESSVRRWQSGQTKNLSGDAAPRLADARTQQKLRQAGAVDAGGRHKRAQVSVQGTVDMRHGGEKSYDFRSNKADTFTLDYAASQQLGHALANNDMTAAVSILEAHASTDYAAFSSYDDGEGWHYEDITELSVDWN